MELAPSPKVTFPDSSYVVSEKKNNRLKVNSSNDKWYEYVLKYIV